MNVNICGSEVQFAMSIWAQNWRGENAYVPRVILRIPSTSAPVSDCFLDISLVSIAFIARQCFGL